MSFLTPRRGYQSVKSLNRRLRRAVEVEMLEVRRLMVIYNPAAVPLLTEPEGATASCTVATFASNTASIGNLSAVVNWTPGTTTLASMAASAIDGIGQEFVPGIGNVNEYAVVVMPTFGESTGVNQPQFTVSITDSGDAPPTTAVAIGTMQVLEAPLTNAGGLDTASTTEGMPISGILSDFNDGDPNGSANAFVANINWGDGTPDTLGTILQPGGPGAVFSVNGTHIYKEEGLYTLTVDVRDTNFGGSEITHTSSIAITDAPLSNGTGTSFTGTEGQTLNNVLLGTFTDANPFGDASDFSAKVNWGDAVADTGVVSLIGGDAKSTTFGIYGSHTYVDDVTAPYTVTVDVTDKGGSTLPTIDSTATISDPLLIMAGGYKLGAVEGASTGTQAVATFIDPGGNETPANYTATIDWGDETPTTTGTITFGGGFFSVSGPHTYAKASSTPYVITTTITHVPGIPQTVMSSATISKAPLKATSTTFNGFEGRSAPVTVANFTATTSTSASNFSASINWGDGKTTAGTIIKDASGRYHVTASHAYAEEQSTPYTVKVTIKQSGGATVSVNSKANIADSPLDEGAGVSLSVSKNSTFSNKTLGTFRDQDALNMQAGDYEGTIDWGDGTKSVASFIFTGAMSNVGSFWKVIGSHKYTTAKTFTVKITIDDTGSPGKKIVISSTIKVA